MATKIITQTILIDGMTCVNCENKIERKLASTIGVRSVQVSYTKGNAIISYDPEIISLDKIKEIIEGLDYHVKKQIQKVNNKVDITTIVAVAAIMLSLFMLINRFGGSQIFNAFPIAKEGMGYGMLLIIGLLTSVHCVAMCGGICLSQCVPSNTADKGSAIKRSALRPSILYNVGRVISYTVIGGIVGAIGSVVSFSGPLKGLVQILAGVFMVIMGLNMLNLFPWLRRFNLRMPKVFANKINAQKRSNSPFYIGLLNGLMPCGPLQAMQLYALSTGSPLKGAMSMLLFSIGTVPLMFAFGALSSLLSKKFTHKMMSVSAVLVVILGIFMLNNGATLSGILIPSITSSAQNNNSNSNIAKVEDGIQTVTTKLTSGRYEPIVVQKGIPVKWIIQAKDSDINGCNNSIVVPKYNLTYDLKAGDNVIEFTPTESGTFSYSCWMGMIRSKIRVVDDINSSDATDPNASASGKSSGYKIPTDELAIATIKDGVQYVEISMDDKRFSPAVVVMQSSIETKWTINGKVITSGNSVVSFPLYNAQVNMKEGVNDITLIPNQDFDFSTSDNAFYGYVKVVKDINDIDTKAIKSEIKAYDPIIQEIDDSASLPSCH